MNSRSKLYKRLKMREYRRVHGWQYGWHTSKTRKLSVQKRGPRTATILGVRVRADYLRVVPRFYGPYAEKRKII